MSADRKTEAFLDNLPVEVLRNCGGCRAQILAIGSPTRFKCQLAELEQKLGQKPSFSQAVSEYIDTSKVPANCPNGY